MQMSSNLQEYQVQPQLPTLPLPMLDANPSQSVSLRVLRELQVVQAVQPKTPRNAKDPLTWEITFARIAFLAGPVLCKYQNSLQPH